MGSVSDEHPNVFLVTKRVIFFCDVMVPGGWGILHQTDKVDRQFTSFFVTSQLVVDLVTPPKQ